MNVIIPNATVTHEPITVAITALGGQGGGVLTQWIVDLAEANGYIAQSTSVPGVAQRTGATIYYVEIFPESGTSNKPILALMPMPGDVDIVISAEMMEAGRAMLRGIVTPDRTTLIASTHRDYSIDEKSAMGNGIRASGNVMDAGERNAKRFIAFDMAHLAAETESVISAVLFGALGGSGRLPFARAAFEDTIRATGRAVETNLAGFAAGFEQAAHPVVEDDEETPVDATQGATTKKGQVLMARVRVDFDQHLDIVAHGVRRMVDYQSYGYAARYLERLDTLQAAQKPGADPEVLGEAARYLALWMSFEDTIRVADLKTRGTRFDRVRKEVRAEDDQLVYVSEFMSPRVEEICELLPAGFGRWMRRTKWARAMLQPFFRKGRRIQTAKLSGFLLLYALGGMRWMRGATLKNVEEQARIDDWLSRVAGASAAGQDTLAREIVECQRLVKGYSETFERGLGSYLSILDMLDGWSAMSMDAGACATRVAELRNAALAGEDGVAFAAAKARLA